VSDDFEVGGEIEIFAYPTFSTYVKLPPDISKVIMLRM